MSFIISGDTHGTLDIKKVTDFFEGKEGNFTKEDYLIILGDVGVCAFLEEDEKETRNILRNLPVTVLFIDGNHEHFPHLFAYPEEIWNGGKIHRIEKDIIHLMRGQIFDINGTKFFTFGGAYSVDKWCRKEGFSWFAQELPCRAEYEKGWYNLESADFKVDYILSHTAPANVAEKMCYGELSNGESELRRFLQRVAKNTDFKAWYFGHFHEDYETDDKFFCLFNRIKVLENK